MNCNNCGANSLSVGSVKCKYCGDELIHITFKNPKNAIEPITRQYCKVGNRAYARIRDTNMIEMWRSRSSKIHGISFECHSSECSDMEAFIKLTMENI